MKRGFIGFSLLLLLLAGGLTSTWVLTRQHTPMETSISQAADCALASDWDNANLLTGWAESQWEQRRNFTAAFADHGPMEEIDGLFAQLEIYQKTRDATTYAAVCAELSRQLRAMGEAHTPTWWNFL